MSRTIRNKKDSGYDFWSRRYFENMGIGISKIAKIKTKERM
jgi:hypothetical protein